MSAGRPRRAVIGIGLLGLFAAVGFGWLGAWQVERRAWKLDLIARVEHRLAAAPVEAPGPAMWPSISRGQDEYRRVRVTGRFLARRRTLVAASTDEGPGFWLMMPLREARGFTVLVNRGFVPSPREAAAVPEGAASLIGLLRVSEPGGDLLRSNDAAAGRWYSRDVAAIAAARRIGPVAPYFIDAAAGPDARPYPHGGLTMVTFPNNHLAYAATWFTLAAMVAGATVFVVRQEWSRADGL
ncbi:SURF1 family protein [Sphingomonas bacterium]|uniref:SURF1 family protein n=1 Tax=Sphingomonas bacterium TaxID=1895847 RepID=UPI001576B3A7|nr:SURF1 family protein [Sphingomonas bacterium]